MNETSYNPQMLLGLAERILRATEAVASEISSKKWEELGKDEITAVKKAGREARMTAVRVTSCLGGIASMLDSYSSIESSNRATYDRLLGIADDCLDLLWMVHWGTVEFLGESYWHQHIRGLTTDLTQYVKDVRDDRHDAWEYAKANAVSAIQVEPNRDLASA